MVNPPRGPVSHAKVGGAAERGGPQPGGRRTQDRDVGAVPPADDGGADGPAVRLGHSTSMRVENGHVRGLALHLERLTHDCRALFSTDLDLDGVREMCRRETPACPPRWRRRHSLISAEWCRLEDGPGR
jgi:hypothetical protein